MLRSHASGSEQLILLLLCSRQKLVRAVYRRNHLLYITLAHHDRKWLLCVLSELIPNILALKVLLARIAQLVGSRLLIRGWRVDIIDAQGAFLA